MSDEIIARLSRIERQQEQLLRQLRGEPAEPLTVDAIKQMDAREVADRLPEINRLLGDSMARGTGV